MVDLGKEFLIVDSYNIPWLIWIQMFVFFLLLLLICAFGILSSDISDNSFPSADSVSSSSDSYISRRFFSGDSIPISVAQPNQIGSSQSMKGEITPAAARRVTGTDEEEEEEENDWSNNLQHPCNLFQLAGSAFLKCFGIDQSAEETDDSLRLPESKKLR